MNANFITFFLKTVTEFRLKTTVTNKSKPFVKATYNPLSSMDDRVLSNQFI